MENNSGCFSLIVSILIGIVIYSASKALGFDMIASISGVIVVAFIILGFIALNAQNKEKRINEKRRQCDLIKMRYPNAYFSYCLQYLIDPKKELEEIQANKILLLTNAQLETREEEEVQRIKIKEDKHIKAKLIINKYPKGFNEWRQYSIIMPEDDEIIANESLIADYDKNIARKEKYEKWEESQSKFASLCFQAKKCNLDKFGIYKYNVEWCKYTKSGSKTEGEFIVPQIFCKSLCKDDTLNYDLRPKEKQLYDSLDDIAIGKISLFPNESAFDDIVNFIKCLNDQCSNEVIVLFYDDTDVICKKVKNETYSLFRDRLNKKGIKTFIMSNYLTCFYDSYTAPQIVIIDYYTENKKLKDKCKDIINLSGIGTTIAYVTLLKCYDSKEMKKIISNAEVKKQEEIKKKNIITALKDNVAEWPLLEDTIHYNFLCYYYPKNGDYIPNDKERFDRRTIWKFKTTSWHYDSTMHEIVLKRVVPKVTAILKNTFGVSLNQLTLVCIPASTQDKTQARYKDFAMQICDETGMINAFRYLEVTEYAKSKHVGGDGLAITNVEFDKDFFNGKNVLLFDDIITSGETMLQFRKMMESLGANVICGLALGKTKHSND